MIRVEYDRDIASTELPMSDAVVDIEPPYWFRCFVLEGTDPGDPMKGVRAIGFRAGTGCIGRVEIANTDRASVEEALRALMFLLIEKVDDVRAAIARMENR